LNSTIFLPKTIKVGYQTRNDTYTGQLAYIIYFDQKGVLRKEKSWQSWRDNKIEPQEFANVPTSGFVLNKKVGDYSSGWDHRKSYCRVYDERNFEFEITIENLLYILENANSIKGKGLEGDFVYGWNNKDLILIPIESPDYLELTKYNEILFQKNYVKAKDLKLGATYKTKTNEEWIYMGRFDYHTARYDRVERPQQTSSYSYYRSYDSVKVDVNKGKHHFFIQSRESKYGINVLTIKSLGERFIDTISTECIENYAELFEKLECTTEYSPYDKNKDEYIQYTFVEFCEKVNDKWLYCFDSQKNSISIRNNERGLCSIEDRKTYKRTEVSNEEAFNILKPMYKNEFLVNGKLYKGGK